MRNRLDEISNMPAGAIAEDVMWYGHDTIILKNISSTSPYAVLDSANLFLYGSGKHQALQTNSFPLDSGRIASIQALRVTHNIKFEDPEGLNLFEEFARLKVKIEDKDYTDIPIFDLLPYNRVNVGESSNYNELINSVQQVATDPVAPEDNEIWYNTATGLLKMFNGTSAVVIPHEFRTQYSALALNGKFKALGQPIDPPHSGKIELVFDPKIKELKTKDATKYGSKFGAGIVDAEDTRVFWIKIAWYGKLIRTTR